MGAPSILSLLINNNNNNNNNEDEDEGEFQLPSNELYNLCNTALSNCDQVRKRSRERKKQRRKGGNEGRRRKE